MGEADYDNWLDPSAVDPAALKYMLDCFPADKMVAEPVSTHVNNLRNNDAECLSPLESK
jgi:putative SOS response-associated peptidase YedK